MNAVNSMVDLTRWILSAFRYALSYNGLFTLVVRVQSRWHRTCLALAVSGKKHSTNHYCLLFFRLVDDPTLWANLRQ